MDETLNCDHSNNLLSSPFKASFILLCGTDFLLRSDSFFLLLLLQESIVDASEDSQLQAAIAASMTYTTSTNRHDDSSGNEDDDDDLEFSESDSEQECKTPQKNVNKTCDAVRFQVKREINFASDGSVDNKERCNDVSASVSLRTRNVNGTKSAKERNKPANAAVTTSERFQKKTKTTAADVSPAGSNSSEEKDCTAECLNERTQEQAGK